MLDAEVGYVDVRCHAAHQVDGFLILRVAQVVGDLRCGESYGVSCPDHEPLFVAYLRDAAA